VREAKPVERLLVVDADVSLRIAGEASAAMFIEPIIANSSSMMVIFAWTYVTGLTGLNRRTFRSAFGADMSVWMKSCVDSSILE